MVLEYDVCAAAVTGGGADVLFVAKVDCTGGEYSAAKRFFSSSAVSCFGGPVAATGAAGVAACISCNDPLTGPGPWGPAETGKPVSAIVGVTAGGRTFAGFDESTLATAATGADVGAAAAGAGGMGAGDWFKTWGSITE